VANSSGAILFKPNAGEEGEIVGMGGGFRLGRFSREREIRGRTVGEGDADRRARPVSGGEERGRGSQPATGWAAAQEGGAGGVSGPRPKGGRGGKDYISLFLKKNIFSKCISFSSNIFLRKIFCF